jgi:MYXO-CTERM domain-containing protein
MSLGTADRARFPKLRVRAEGLASKPTEQTWWIDDGPHAAWTTANDLVVDQDAMLLQGKHVLHVSSRVVGVMASEDGTPAELPFTIDTLAPLVDVKRDGTHVVVRAHDYVSADGALVVRRRIGDEGVWSDWAPLAAAGTFEAASAAAVEVEVRDEEGNIGTVAQPLRGRADGSLAAAGSGCGCRVVSAPTDRRTDPWLALGVALAAAGMARRRRR